MPIMRFENLADIGVMNDMSPYDIPMNAWTDSQNVRFDDGKVTKMKGHEQVFGTPSGTPHYAIQMPVGANNFWFYASLTDTFAYDGSTHELITPDTLTGSCAATAQIGWTGGVLGGAVLVLNNGVNRPFQWKGTAVDDQMAILSSWPATQVARVLRPFNQFLVAADIDEGAGGGRVGDQIMWSHPATSGNVPSSWDYNDSTKDAGTAVLAQGGDYIIDMKPLRDINMVYKDDSAWTQEFIGGAYTFRFRRVFDHVGILSRRCVQDFLGRHLVVVNGDVLLHDGLNTEQPLARKLVKKLFSEIDTTNYDRSYVSINYTTNEVWICYPTSGEEFANKALIWNWKNNTQYFRDLPQKTAHIEWGIVDPNASQTFEDTDGTYADQDGIFDEQSYSGALRNMLFCEASGTPKFYRPEQTEQFDGSNFTAYAERTALPLGAQSLTGGGMIYDPRVYIFVREIWPIIEGTDGGVVTIKVGYRNTPNDSVSWTDYTYTIGTTTSVKTRVEGRIIDIRFQSTTNITWSLMRYAVDYDIGGAR